MLKSFKKNQKGFTLVELMVVVVIIGILTAIAVPVYNSVTKSANRRAVEANLRTIDGAIMQRSTNPDATDPPSKDNLEGSYLQAWPIGPDGVTYSITNTSPYRAVVNKGTDTDTSWFTADGQSLPIEW